TPSPITARARRGSDFTAGFRMRLLWKLFLAAALVAAGILLRPIAFPSQAGVTGESLTVEPTALSFWVEATGVLRATSVRNYGGPPAFGDYWQFQIVSLAPEGNNVKTGDVLIKFDAQRIHQDRQHLQSELDQSAKELEKTK